MKNQAKLVVEVIKDTAVQMIKVGVPVESVAKQIAAKFGNTVARLTIADVALDLGMVAQTRNYLAQF